ncbi:hypothetical protein [Bradyrhizobium jicamae]|uniref:hypothetical protein n=1 Tax=Bradyrhizobium jicamae TaxID=280332 RepID=UPI001BAD4C53|nr:hypothetical protein [Bradyrhizobium jicamae]MBR0937304.1 hypothetical protein [Bradyrhizobium jicamae]
MTIRLLNTNNLPATGINPPANWPNGKQYSIPVSGTLDVAGVDEAAMLAGQHNGGAGFFIVGDSSGPTSARPVNIRIGWMHVDTTLNKTVTFDGSTWRDPATGAVV